MTNTERPSAAPQGHDRCEEALRCPRCDSPHTKFCYYNNYSRSQPRHFCKACKRYWTHGGTLRNVPVGGGSRKNKRATRPPTAATTTRLAAPIADAVRASRSIADQSSSSSLGRSLACQGLPSSGRLQEIHALGFPLVRFDHAVDLDHLRQLHRSPKKAEDSDQGFLFPYEGADDYGRLSYFDSNSVGAHQRQYLLPDDSSFMQAGAAEATMVQNDLFWSPKPECQILPITDHTSHLYSIDNS